MVDSDNEYYRYTLSVDDSGATVTGASVPATAHGTATLLQQLRRSVGFLPDLSLHRFGHDNIYAIIVIAMLCRAVSEDTKTKQKDATAAGQVATGCDFNAFMP